MKCECLTRIDEGLKKHGFKLSDKFLTFMVNDADLSLHMALTWPLERLDGKRLLRKDPKGQIMSHCPFCGQPIKREEREKSQTIAP